MQKKYGLSFPIDATLDKAIQAEVTRTGLSRADVARTALRVMLGLLKPEKGGAHATR
jgi:hypothetical protein